MQLWKKIDLLVVEDESPKRRHLVDAINAINADIRTTESASVTDALNLLEDHSFDLIILDMSLPTYSVDEVESGGRPQAFGGLEILQTMVLLEIETPVIVVTGFEAFERSGDTIDLDTLRTELEEEYGSFLRSVIHFNSVVDGWKTQLKINLEKILVEQNT